MNELTIQSNAVVTEVPPTFFPAIISKQERSRLNKFVLYMTDRSWLSVNLTQYAAYLISTGLSPASVKAHLSTLRTALGRVKRDRDYWYGVAAQIAPNAGTLELKAIVDEIVVRYTDAIEPVKIEVAKVQDKPDSEFIRLTLKQQKALLTLPNRDSLAGLRDAAIIGMALATGLRADELCALTVADLKQTVEGEIGVLVREGKGNKQRFVPYGAEKGVLTLVSLWLARAGIVEGDVFRGVTNTGYIKTNGIDPNTFNRRLARYPLDSLELNPHDLRRTYAKTRYQQGMDIVSISKNLGHADIKTTMNYIGETDIERRLPTAGLDYA